MPHSPPKNIMLISYDDRFVFFHIPRCAGSTVHGHLEKHLKRNRKRHKIFWHKQEKRGREVDTAHLTCRKQLVTWWGHFTNVDRDLSSYYKFTFVRNPYDRCVSSYNWQWERKRFPPEKPFSAFLEVMQANQDRWEERKYVHFFPGTLFTHNHDGSQYVDFIGKQENLHTDLAEVLRWYRIPQHDLQDKNVRMRAGAGRGQNTMDESRYLKHHTPRTIAIINELYKDDFKRFGYEVISPTDARVANNREWYGRDQPPPSPPKHLARAPAPAPASAPAPAGDAPKSVKPQGVLQPELQETRGRGRGAEVRAGADAGREEGEEVEEGEMKAATEAEAEAETGSKERRGGNGSSSGGGRGNNSDSEAGDGDGRQQKRQRLEE